MEKGFSDDIKKENELQSDICISEKKTPDTNTIDDHLLVGCKNCSMFR